MTETIQQSPAEQAVAQASEVPPGTHKVIAVRSMEIGLYNVDGTFFAVQNLCPHQYGPACAGGVGAQAICNAETGWMPKFINKGQILTCPWHGMEFDVTTGQCLTEAHMRLRSFPVRVVDGEVRVQLASRRTAAAAPAD